MKHLHDHIMDTTHPTETLPASEREEDIQDAMAYTLSRISGNLQCYPDHVLTPYVKI